MKTPRLLTAAAALFALAQCLGCVTEADSDLQGLDEETAEAEEAIVNGTPTTGFAPVVRISWTRSYSCGLFNWDTCTTTYLCTATAISDDVLATASHCVRHNKSEADYVKVEVAHGANSGAAGKTSSYLIGSQDVYDNLDEDDDEDQYWYRDFTFIKFGAGTFSEYYGTTYSDSPIGTSVVKVGFGGNSTKEYTSKTVVTTDTFNGGDYRLAGTSRSGAYNENGDSGGPLLKMNSTTGEYEVLGVVYGTGFWGGVEYDAHPIFTSAMETNILSKLRTNLPKYCSENYKDSNYSGSSWSFCNRTSINNQLDSFSDPFFIDSHWNFGGWNDEMSSLELPTANTVLTLYQDTGNGGSFVTFQNLYPFGSLGSVPSLTNESFNDKASSFYMTSGASKNNTDWAIEITRHGKCIDTSGTHSVGTDVYQWSCSGNDNQTFRMQASGSYYQIKHTASGLCLGAEGGGTSNGVRVELQTCDGSNKQLWDIYNNSSTSSVRDFKVKNVNAGKCMDLDGGDSANGTALQIWSCSSSNLNQNYALKKYN